MTTNEWTAPSELASGGHVSCESSSLTIQFDTIHYALSTGPLNGGFHHVLGVRNQQLTMYIDTEQDLPGGSASAYLAMEFEQIDIPVHYSTALLTSASMDRHVYVKEEEDGIIVEAIITGNYEKTGHRAGTGYYYKEQDGQFTPAGTINTLVFTNIALPDGAMTRAIITMTEAKTAAFQDANILINDQLVTGTATDGIILTINPDGEILTDTGTFSQLGDMFSRAVYKGVTQRLKDAQS